MEYNKESFKKIFPNLAKELGDEENRMTVNSVRTDVQTAEDAASRKFLHYMPDIIDFLRRCNTKKQAEEIIAYMEKRGEIEKQYAEKLRHQLKNKGLRSFGPKKEEGHYFRQEKTKTAST